MVEAEEKDSTTTNAVTKPTVDKSPVEKEEDTPKPPTTSSEPSPHFPSRLFVVLPKEKTWSDQKLRTEFSKVQGLVSVSVGRDRTGKPRGFAFVQYTCHRQALAALELFKSSFQVSWATEKPSNRNYNHEKRSPYVRKEVKRSLSPRERPVEKRPKKKNVSSKLFVTSRYKYSRQELDAMFRIYGNLNHITSVPVQGKLKTMAYVYYNDVTTAADVVESMAVDATDDSDASSLRSLTVVFAQEEDSENNSPQKIRKSKQQSPATTTTRRRRDEDEKLLSTVEQRLAHLMRNSNSSSCDSPQNVAAESMIGSHLPYYYPYVQYGPSLPYYNYYSNASTSVPPPYYAAAVPSDTSTGYYTSPYVENAPVGTNTNHPGGGYKSNETSKKSSSSSLKIGKSTWVVILCDKMLEESELRDICNVYGVIESLILDADHKHAYLKFDSVEATNNVIHSLNGRVLFQQSLNVFAVPSPPPVSVGRRKRPRMDCEGGSGGSSTKSAVKTHGSIKTTEGAEKKKSSKSTTSAA